MRLRYKQMQKKTHLSSQTSVFLRTEKMYERSYDRNQFSICNYEKDKLVSFKFAGFYPSRYCFSRTVQYFSGFHDRIIHNIRRFVSNFNSFV